jgi:hypothetical protein
MSASLARVMRIRRLLEEAGRAELAGRAAERRLWEAAIEQAERQAQTSGREAHEAIRHDRDSPGRSRWLEDGDNARLQASRLQARLAALLAAEEEARQRYMGLRLETRQIEQLVAQEQSRADRESAKREQQAMDDWFGARQSRS